MGANFSQTAIEAKEQSENEFHYQGFKIKQKELPQLAKRLCGEFPELTQLEINSCRIKAIPSTITLFSHLQVLKLIDNKITIIPLDITELKNLTEVDFSENNLAKVPLELATCSTLKSLTLRSNQISVFPYLQARDFSSLEKLDFAQNEFTAFPIQICSLLRLTSLNFGSNKFNSIEAVDEISRLVNLKEFTIKSNYITGLPQSISRLHKLTSFHCSENLLTILPSSFSNLNSLTTLELQHNQFTIFPIEICSLYSLSTLKLHGNQITEIPPNISNLINLNELYMQENRLLAVPPEIGKLSNLRKLYLEYNLLADLPEEISLLRRLVVFIVHHNLITKLPKSLPEMTSLLRFSLDDNPLSHDLLSIIKQHGALSLIKDEIDEGEIEALKAAGSLSAKSRLTNQYRRRSLAPDNSSLAAATINFKKSGPTPPTSPLIKSKDAETGVPTFAKFKTAFDSLLEEQDFSHKKKEVLKKLPDSEKWSLLNQYKGSTLQLLKQQAAPHSPQKGWMNTAKKKSNNLTVKGPKEFIATLKDKRINRNLLSRLKSTLKENLDNWLASFIDFGGITALSTLLHTVCLRKSNEPKDLTIIQEILEVFTILLGLSFKSVLTSSGAVNAISMALSSDEANKLLVMSIFDSICKDAPNIGPELMAEGIYQYSIEFNEELRYFPIISMLQSNQPVFVKQICMRIINNTINSITDLNHRFALRMELNQMGIQDLLHKFKEEYSPTNLLVIESTIFEEETNLDYEDMRCKFSRTRMRPLRPQRYNNNNLSPTPTPNPNNINIYNLNQQSPNIPNNINININNNINNIIKDNAQTHIILNNNNRNNNNNNRIGNNNNTSPKEELAIYVSAESIQAIYTEFVDEYTLTEHVLRNIATKYMLKQTENFGIYLGEEMIGKKEKIFQYVKLSLEYRLISWELSIQLPHSKLIANLISSPNSACGEVVSQIVEMFSLQSEVDYTLFLPPDISFDDTKLLSSILLLVDIPANRKLLELRENSIKIRVYIGSETWQLLEFDPQISVSLVFAKIVGSSNLLTKHDEYQLIIETSNGSTPLTDHSLPLSAIPNIRDNASIRLVRRETGKEEEGIEEDVNIWDEPADSPHNITYDSSAPPSINSIETATLNKLVERLTSPDEYSGEFVSLFVMMYESFTTDEKLFSKLADRFIVPPQYDQIISQKIKGRVAIFLKYWVENRPEISPSLRNSITRFVREKMNAPPFELTAKVILDRLQNPKITETMILEKPPPPILPKSPPPYVFYEIDELEIARQLTIKSFDIYKKIKRSINKERKKPSEFFKLAWGKDKYKHMSPNILELIDNYNKVSRWVATSIVIIPKVRDRARLFQRLITIAEKLKELNNFHLLSAFVSAFNNSAIHRLKHTKARLPKRHQSLLFELEQIVSMESSFSSYRAALENAKPPCVPFLGVYLTDLVFVTDGNPDFIENRINLFKHKFIFKVITIIQKYQMSPYVLEKVDPIHLFLNSLKCLSDNDLHKHSLKIEPRGVDRAEIL